MELGLLETVEKERASLLPSKLEPKNSKRGRERAVMIKYFIPSFLSNLSLSFRKQSFYAFQQRKICESLVRDEYSSKHRWDDYLMLLYLNFTDFMSWMRPQHSMGERGMSENYIKDDKMPSYSH